MRTPVFGRTNGLSTMSHPFGLRSGEGDDQLFDLSVTNNVIVDDERYVRSIAGPTLLDDTDWHSVFEANGTIFGVNNAELTFIELSFDNNGVFAGMVKYPAGVFCASNLAYALVNGIVFFVSETEKGIVGPGMTVSPWTLSSATKQRTDRHYDEPPLGSSIAFHASRIWVGADNILLYSDILDYSRFNYGSSFFQFNEKIVSMSSIGQVLFVFLEHSLYAISGLSDTSFSMKLVMRGTFLRGCSHVPDTSMAPLSKKENNDLCFFVEKNGLYSVGSSLVPEKRGYRVSFSGQETGRSSCCVVNDLLLFSFYK